jgi:hypothetical protein
MFRRFSFCLFGIFSPDSSGKFLKLMTIFCGIKKATNESSFLDLQKKELMKKT